MNVKTSTVNGTPLKRKTPAAQSPGRKQTSQFETRKCSRDVETQTAEVRFAGPHLLRLIDSGGGGGENRTSLPVAAVLVLSRDDGQRGVAWAAPGGRSGCRGDQRQASSLRPSGEEERVVRSRQFPTSRGPLGVRVSSCLADWENETGAQRTTSPPACFRTCVHADAASFLARLSFSPEAGRGRCSGRGWRRSRHVRLRAFLEGSAPLSP